MIPPELPKISRTLSIAILVAIALLCCTRNLPWHLDNYDQAKQAYTSFEMVKEGHWWFQHTPTGRIATKPPLAGWVSAGLYELMGSHWWDGAWRIPSLAGTAFVLWLLWRSGNVFFGNRLGGILACAAFGLTVFTPRIASLVRTDMLLTATIVLSGWLVLERVRIAQPWHPGDRWLLFFSVLISMLIKGPITYVFLLPGLVAYAVCARRFQIPNHSWSGFWPWLTPLLVFGVWAGTGIYLSQEFYDQVVLREFLGRFSTGENAVHQPRNPIFYVGLILLRWQPWGLLLVASMAAKPVRARLTADPVILWLVCWAMGGLVLMSAIPSKRFDRILPVIPPLCLLLAAVARDLPHQISRFQTGTLLRVSLGLAFLFSSIYAGMDIWESFRTRQNALVAFGNHAAQMAAVHGGHLAVVTGKDEGMLMYSDQTHFTHIDQIMSPVGRSQIDWLLIPENVFTARKEHLPGFQSVAATGRIPGKSSAYLLLQSLPAAPAEGKNSTQPDPAAN